jgi:hypothetical protein
MISSKASTFIMKNDNILKTKKYNIQDFKTDNIYTMAGGVIIFDGAIVFLMLYFRKYR